MKESYEWVEQLVAFQPVVRQWQSAVRDGLLQSGVVPDNGFTYDHIDGTKVGGTIFDPYGHRHTAADLLQHADPSRITVLLHATVHRILFRSKGVCARSYLHFSLSRVVPLLIQETQQGYESQWPMELSSGTHWGQNTRRI